MTGGGLCKGVSRARVLGKGKGNGMTLTGGGGQGGSYRRKGWEEGELALEMFEEAKGQRNSKA